MAFNDKEQEIIKYGLQNGKSRQEIEQAIIRLRTGYQPSAEPPAVAPQSGVVDRLATIGDTTASTIRGNIEGTGEFAGQSPIRRGAQATAAGFKAPIAAAGALLPAPVRSAIDYVGSKAGQAFKSVTDRLADTKFISEAANAPEATKTLEDALGATVALGDTANSILAAEGARAGLQKTVDLTKAAASKATDIVSQARPGTEKLINRSKELIKPSPTPEKALGEVLQAKKPLTPQDVIAFKNINTEGVKTYADLSSRIKQSISKLSGTVDEHLAQDPTPIPLNNLTTRITSGSGKVIERNFVQNALDHLKELYQKTADDVALADIEDTIAKAQTTGLTRLEVNDISRVYNSEFGSKAFSKVTGEPLTSVNAQAYENIRTGLKTVARAGMGGAEAQATDKIITSLYNVRDLITKNAAAVQKLEQKISERGLLEKVGHLVAKYGDIATGGTLRGFISGLLPRGAGYKVMNALDLEERLSKNLQIIQNALNSSSDEAILTAIKKIGEAMKTER